MKEIILDMCNLIEECNTIRVYCGVNLFVVMIHHKTIFCVLFYEYHYQLINYWQYNYILSNSNYYVQNSDFILIYDMAY